ncbi:uncharacterized protein EAF01_000507 [Botrytis porri]|uniref:uncharacterized protein n=1 Tax=Botrytis porri TaxID=87229 RepID=UPI001900C32B|nr:uncharacterized protein EAF01_000507 [Botrytis porri]KAF7914101.1 hypothetical protein EAF01_000507 [Botrytis porri]
MADTHGQFGLLTRASRSAEILFTIRRIEELHESSNEMGTLEVQGKKYVKAYEKDHHQLFEFEDVRRSWYSVA